MDLLLGMNRDDLEEAVLAFYRCCGITGKAAILEILAQHNPDDEAAAAMAERAALLRDKWGAK
jgi:hypothetical protein